MNELRKGICTVGGIIGAQKIKAPWMTQDTVIVAKPYVAIHIHHDGKDSSFTLTPVMVNQATTVEWEAFTPQTPPQGS